MRGEVGGLRPQSITACVVFCCPLNSPFFIGTRVAYEGVCVCVEALLIVDIFLSRPPAAAAASCLTDYAGPKRTRW